MGMEPWHEELNSSLGNHSPGTALTISHFGSWSGSQLTCQNLRWPSSLAVASTPPSGERERSQMGCVVVCVCVCVCVCVVCCVACTGMSFYSTEGL